MIILKPAPSSPTQVARRHAHVVEAQVRGVAAQPAHLVEARARQARRVARHHEASRCPRVPASPVRTATVIQSARMPEVMNTFSP
jgi:hypothetical protein